MSPRSAKCEDCGCMTDRCIRRHPHGDASLSLFLCASCEYLRENPDAAPRILMPNERRPLPLQSERLF